MKFYASLRIQLARIASLKDSKEQEIGFDVQATCIKARYSTPRAKALYSVVYETGIDCHRALANMAVSMNIIERAGSWYTMLGERYQGLANVLKKLHDDEAQYQELTRLVQAAMPAGDEPDEVELDESA